MNSEIGDNLVGIDEVVDQILDGIVDRKTVDIESICRNYPQHANELRRVLPSLKALEDLNAATSSRIADTQRQQWNDTAVPDQLGEYRIIRQLGRGGMGIVFEAEQTSLGRRVALKVLPMISLLDSRQVLRFKNEARAAALLQHPNIVRIHAVDFDCSMHFYAMELVDGFDLAEVSRRIHGATSPDEKQETNSTGPIAKLSTQRSTSGAEYYRSIARLGVQAANALEYAHSRGVIHRDIKPSNLLIDQGGELRVTDFGLAQIQSDATLTASGDLLGTLRYMSPEQMDGSRCVDARTDIFSLGMTLYELLSGQPARGALSRAELVSQINSPPKRIREHARDIPTDLQTIVEKAMALEVDERYQSCEELREDLVAFLGLRSIRARPSTQFERLRRFAKRNPTLTAAFSVAGLSLLLLALVTSAWAIGNQRRIEVDGERLAASKETERLQRHELYAADMRIAQQLAEERKLVQLQEILLRWVPPSKDATDLRGFEWYHLWQNCEDSALIYAFDLELPAYDVGFLDDHRVMTLGFSSRPKVFSLKSENVGTPQHILEASATILDGIGVHAETQQVAVGDSAGSLTCWATDFSKQLFQYKSPPNKQAYTESEKVNFNSDGSQVMMTGGSWAAGYLRLWEVGQEDPIFSTTSDSEIVGVFGPANSIITGELFGDSLNLIEQGNWNERKQVLVGGDGVVALGINEEKSLVAVAVQRKYGALKTYRVRILEVGTWETIWEIDLSAEPRQIMFAGTDRLLWCDQAGEAWIVRIDRAEKTCVVELRKKLHSEGIGGIDLSPNQERLITASWDGFAAVWDLSKLLTQQNPSVTRYPSSDFCPQSVALVGDRDRVLIGVRDQGVREWNIRTGEVESSLPIDVTGAANVHVVTSKNGKACVSLGAWPKPEKDAKTRFILWDPATKEKQEVRSPALGVSGTDVAMSPDGSFCVGCSHHEGLVIFNTKDRLKIMATKPEIPAKTIRISGDSKTIAVGGADGVAYIIRASDLECIDEIKLEDRLIDCIDISNDGNTIATVGFDRRIKVHDRKTNSTREFEETLPSFPCLVRFSPDEKRIMTGTVDGALRLWSNEIGKVTQAWKFRAASWPKGEFSADGRSFIMGCVGEAAALHAPQVDDLKDDLRRLPASVLRSRACQNISEPVAW